MAERGGIVQVVIKAKDLASSVIGRFRRNLRSITRTVKDVVRGITAFTVAGAGMLFGLTKMGQAGARVIGVKRTFAKITEDEVAALELLRGAAAGTISDFKLMAFHNQALALGAAESTEQFGRMVTMARALGRAQDLDALQAVESLTTGIGRQSIRWLDNLGIIIDVEKANETYAAALGRQASTLTDAEKKIAFRNAALRQGEELVASLTGAELRGVEAGDKFAASMVNIRDRLNEVVAESPLVAAFFEQLTGIISDIVDLIGADSDTLIEGMKSLGRMAGDAFAVGVNEAIAALPENTAFDRFLLKLVPDKFEVNLQERFFGGNADTARENLDANREAFRSTAAAARAQADERRVAKSAAGQAVLNRRRLEEIALLERRQAILQDALRQDAFNADNRALLSETSLRIQELRRGHGVDAERAPGGGDGDADGDGRAPSAASFAGGSREDFEALAKKIAETRNTLQTAERDLSLETTQEGADKAKAKVDELRASLEALLAVAERFGGEDIVRVAAAKIAPVTPGLIRPAPETEKERRARLLPFGDGSDLSLSRGGRESFFAGLERDAAAAAAADKHKKDLEEGEKRMQHAGEVTVAAMLGMGEAAIRGSDQVASSVVSMISRILQASVGGGVFGVLIGGIGGLISAGLSRDRNEPIPVRVDDYGSSAERKLKQLGGGPIRFTTIIEQGGVEISRIEEQLFDRQERDEVVRFPVGTVRSG